MSDTIIVRGRRKLYGNVFINGMKNAALPIICACILNREECILDNIPPVSDIDNLLCTLEYIGATVKRITKTSVAINCENVVPCSSPKELTEKIRGSSYLLGAELGRFGKASIYFPGGCSIGARPLNYHSMVFEALGANSFNRNSRMEVESEGRLEGADIHLEMPSVGATANAILASVYANGTTRIFNSAREPHIVDLAAFLNACGAKISGAGTDIIKIKGVDALHGCRYSIVPDMIEAGTYMVAAATAGGEVTVNNIIPKHLEIIISKMREAGVTIDVGSDSVTVKSTGELKAIKITTAPYPGFATDMQPQFGAMLSYANGISEIKEEIFENRFLYTNELSRMGANITTTQSRQAFIVGQKNLHGASVICNDLRAGAAMIIAGLAADGETEIDGIDKIERGYYNIVGKLAELGADIQKKAIAKDNSLKPVLQTVAD